MTEPLNNIRVVLVNTTHPGNIGGAARALKNMGLSQIVLVAPKEFPSERAVWRAANAADLLEQVRVVDTVDEAIADCGLVIGTSARDRRIPWPLLTPRECADKTVGEAATHPVAILFGREDRGLTNEELQKCHFHLHIPANPDYSSLNLAAAVQVVVYEIRMSWLTAQAGQPPHFDDWDQPPARQQDVEMYFEHLEQTLAQIGFFDPANPRQTLTRIRRLFSRIRLDQMELSILRGILTSMQNHIHHSGTKVATLEQALDDLRADKNT